MQDNKYTDSYLKKSISVGVWLQLIQYTVKTTVSIQAIFAKIVYMLTFSTTESPSVSKEKSFLMYVMH